MKTKNRTGAVWRTALFAAAIAALVAFGTASAFAQKVDDLKINLVAKKVVVKKDGTELLESADRAKPGDTIQYTAVYQNKSAALIRNLEPTLPIPAGMEYMGNTAKPGPTKASPDGKDFEAVPLKKRVLDAEGKEKQIEMPAGEYRALRWFVGDLKAGESVTVVARVRVSATTQASNR